ncbi:MAG TPA: biotin/lipoyl-containing protein, partial [Anaerolineales bacterium]
MATKIVVPELGESVLEATVSRWLKKEGDLVNVGDVLVELETDKVNLEVGAKNPGILAKIEVPEGEDVKVGDVLGMIEENGKQPQATSSKAEAPAPEPEPQKVEEKQEAVRTDGQESQRGSTPQLTPVASRLARENNVDVSQLTGTGIEGRVTKTDVEQFLHEQEKARETEKQAQADSPSGMTSEAQPEKPASVPPLQIEKPSSVTSAQRQEERMRMSRRRRTIAQRLLEAKQNTAMLTTFNEIDMSAVMDLRKRRNEEFQKRHEIKLGFMSFFVKAAI